MNKASETQGAAMLAAKDPVAAMDEHEASMRRQRAASRPPATTRRKGRSSRKNTALMNSFGFASIPTIVAQHATNRASW